jgi:REP element-mobilizing transposase RayT
MPYDPDRHARRSIRLRDYDYTQPGAYFVTLCTYQRECLLGDVVNGEIVLNGAGEIVRHTLAELPQRLPGIEVQMHVIMPNHLHGIILVGAQFIAPIPQTNTVGISGKSGVMNHAPTLGNVVRAFKAISTRRIRTGSNSTFAWQRNYYEHVLRDEEALTRAREYIALNPLRWHLDEENPRNR